MRLIAKLVSPYCLFLYPPHHPQAAAEPLPLTRLPIHIPDHRHANHPPTHHLSRPRPPIPLPRPLTRHPQLQAPQLFHHRPSWHQARPHAPARTRRQLHRHRQDPQLSAVAPDPVPGRLCPVRHHLPFFELYGGRGCGGVFFAYR